MDYSKITASDIAKNPQLLYELKQLATSGMQLQKLKEERQNEFIAANFYDSEDAALVFDRLKVKPILNNDLSLGFEGSGGQFLSIDSVLKHIEEDGRGYYLKSSKPDISNNKPVVSQPQKVTDNPWVTGNRTQQLLMMQSNPERAAKLKESAGKQHG